MKRLKNIQLICLVLVPISLFAQKTETVYLSGTDAEHTNIWEFYCSGGMNSRHWTTIKVPSCWEQQGFGSYNYGHDMLEDRLNETGSYRYNFKVPITWMKKQVEIVFDGVMTDAEVKINGKSAGSIHQGAFYQFRYDISKLIKPGENQLTVFVKKHSGNQSINEAERHSDYWVFGGIFRPVYLEIKPKTNICRVAIDAKASGKFKADVFLVNNKSIAKKIKVDIQSINGESQCSFLRDINGDSIRVSGQLNSPQTWTPEFPNLYNVVLSLIDKKGHTVHQYSERIGFRTVEVRESDGIYLNGVKIKMQGVCRHTFHPIYGRTSSTELSIEAVNLMKDMNMNAVRMSHYPPDKHFLDVCDSLGLLVLDELAGWQKPSYDENIGRKLLKEMIAHDANHPCIILWDNGNEGGENNKLNNDFAKFDIQNRMVLHPWQDYGLTNTFHYPDYNYLALDGISKRKIFFPTEFLHGLYDGGLGAGLDDYWQKMWGNPLCAGGFLWVFADESLARTDRDWKLDSDGNHAPDGILGPYGEKEGSFNTIKEIWSPIQFETRYITSDFNGTFHIENRYFYTNLNLCTFIVDWVDFISLEATQFHEKIGSTQNLKIDLAPSQKGILQINLPDEWQDFDMLRIKAIDQYGRFLYTWSWPVKYPEVKAKDLLANIKRGKLSVQETDNELIISDNQLTYVFNKKNGTIVNIKTGGRIIPLSNGPIFISGHRELKQVRHFFEENSLVIETLFDNEDIFRWTVCGNGFIDLDVAYEPNQSFECAGVTFDYPEKNVEGMRWLGNGPYRVYRNRMKGVEFGLWEKKNNNSITGESGFIYPEFSGYYSEVYWAKIIGEDVPDFTIYIQSKDIFLRMLTPELPKDPAKTKIDYPQGNISFLHGINAIGTKFIEAAFLGPQSHLYQFKSSRIHEGKLKMKITFSF